MQARGCPSFSEDLRELCFLVRELEWPGELRESAALHGEGFCRYREHTDAEGHSGRAEKGVMRGLRTTARKAEETRHEHRGTKRPDIPLSTPSTTTS